MPQAQANPSKRNSPGTCSYNQALGPLNIYCFFLRLHKYYVFSIKARMHTHILEHMVEKYKPHFQAGLGLNPSSVIMGSLPLMVSSLARWR